MLICMAVYDTQENNRSWMTNATLESLASTVDFSRHRLVVSDNGSCAETHEVYERWASTIPFEVIYNGKNIGTAAAINRGWRLREPGECAAKMDNDVVIHQAQWADWMEDVFYRDPRIGICGLKRKDLKECPWSTNSWWQSKIRMLPHEPGHRWLVVEKVNHVMGTCQGYSAALLARMGYLYQPGLYGFDDSLSAVRAEVLGFESVFLCGFDIDHIDPGGTAFTEWKMQYAGTYMRTFNALRDDYRRGRRDPYYDGGFA